MALDQMNVDDWEYDDDGRPVPQETEMSFIDHLEELRWHIIRSLAVIAVLGIVLFIFHDWYFTNILLGPLQDDFYSYDFLCAMSNTLGLGESLCFGAPDVELQAVGFGEQFITAIKMSFFGGFVGSFPYVFYEVWSFIRPGLYPNEQRATRWVIAICSLLFFTGLLFGFLIIAPFGSNFLMNFTIGDVVNKPLVGDTVMYMVMFTLPAAIIFQLPVLVHFLATFGLVTKDTMRQYRKHSFIGILILASILTPPDVVTQILIALPLYILYEISIFVAGRAQKKYEADLD